MKRVIKQFVVVLLMSIVMMGTYAQDRRTLDTKVADLLAQMPANDLVHVDRVMEELVGLGAGGFDKLFGFLTPAGTGDDTAVRFAVESVVRYASGFGREQERELVEKSLLKALEKSSDTEVRTFLLDRLRLVASDASVDPVKKYLSEPDMVEPVTQTLLSLGSKSAAQALYTALPKAGPKAQIPLVKALGTLTCGQALPGITTLAGSSDPALQKVVLEALANIGNPASYKLLENAAKSVRYAYDPTNAAEAFINYADRLAENGELKLARKALNGIMKANRDEKQLYNHAAALSIFAGHFGYEAMPLLLKGVESNHKPYRYAVLNIAEKVGGVAGTRQWIARAQSASGDVRAEIIDMLGRRGDPLAIGFIAENLKSESSVVRADAIEALVKLQGSEAVPLLIDHLTKGNDTEVAKSALMGLLSQKHLAPLAAKLGTTSGATKAALIDLIAAKSGDAYFPEILQLTGSSDKSEKRAAFQALKSVSDIKNLDALIALLLKVEDANEIQQVQQAIVETVKGNETEKSGKGKLIQTLRTTTKKDRIIAILPEMGGDVALAEVTSYFKNGSGSTKDAAFQALLNWKDYAAAASLFEVCESSTGDYRKKAFASFVNQVRGAKIADDQKLLQYRKVMPYAAGVTDQTMVIRAIGDLKTFLSLVYLEQYLDSEKLQQVAGRAIMKVALPDSDGKNAFSGTIVRDLLKRTASLLKGEESDYDIININNYLAKMPAEAGMVSMFNGKDLSGWQGLVGNPVTRARMSAEELAEKQKEADQKVLENWSVKDNSIVFSGKGANLCSVKEYGDFEMIVDWRITKEGDSGIYLRGSPQVQIWDTSRVSVGAQVGSGGLYNNKKYESKPLKVADNPIGEWNTFRITMIGENVTVYLNGELVVDNVPLENYWDRTQSIFPTGPIELQAHGTDLAFRDIYVREIKTDEIGLTEEEKSTGFVSLFNGANLDGWQGNTTDYHAQDGTLVVQPSRGGRGNLFTVKEYDNFIFRFDFQLTPGANNGLGIRAPLEGDAAYLGMELQILDDTAPIYANLEEYQYHGSVYGIIAAKRGYLNPVGEWNSQEVIVTGSKVKITLNGTVIVDGDLKEATKNGTLDGKDHPGLLRDKGYIGFLGHGSELKFRNIRVKEL